MSEIKNENVKNSKKVQAVIDTFVTKEMQKTDPQGCYTGKPINKYEKPVQDQDDL